MFFYRLTCRFALLLGLGWGAGLGCVSDEGDAEAAPVFYYEHARPILEAKCATCHFKGGVAPFTLDTYEKAYGMKDAIAVAVSQGTMPPWLADPSCNDYTGDPSLTVEEKATLLEWVSSGALEGDREAEGEPVENPAAAVQLSRSDLTLQMAEPYTPVMTPDDYRCFILDLDLGGEEPYVTGFRASPGNLKVVHHVIAYLIPEEQVATVMAQDNADPEQGYRCFGGPGITQGFFQWLGAWAPGGQGADYPAGTGIKLTTGAKVVLQVHYNTLGTSAEPDTTSVDFMLESEVEHEASILLWLNFSWLFGNGMSIPAGESRVEHSHITDPTLALGPMTNEVFNTGESFRIHWVSLHMHELGTTAKLSIQSGGAEQCLLDIPRWDFNWQLGYWPRSSVIFNPGDRLKISCTWDNSPGNQRRVDGEVVEPRDVSWGDGTSDEMCLGVLYISRL